MGYLVKEDKGFFSNNVFCKLYFETEKQSDKPIFSRIYTTSDNSGTSNFLRHAAKVHDIFDYDYDEDNTPNVAKQCKPMPWLNKVKEKESSRSQWEFNRDLGILVCRDLLPFDLVEKPGFTAFIERNSKFTLPSADTLSGTVLLDIYGVLKLKIKQLLLRCTSATVIMDGWTDKHNALPYFAIRLSTIIEWE